MIRDDNPTFADWDQDATAISERYHEQDPNAVAYGLAVNAGKYTDMLDREETDQWARPGFRSNGSAFTVESFGRYLLHDPVHHLWDVETDFEAIAEARGQN